MSVPFWALTLAYWLHMLATVVWVGSLACLSILVLPAARQAFDPTSYAKFLEKLQKRLDPLGWFCLALLIGTGLVQMSASPNYDGFLVIENRWAVAILVKHLLFFVMVIISGYLTWILLPQTRRVMLSIDKIKNSPDNSLIEKLNQQERRLIRINLLLGVVILALTAIARAA